MAGVALEGLGIRAAEGSSVMCVAIAGGAVTLAYGVYARRPLRSTSAAMAVSH